MKNLKGLSPTRIGNNDKYLQQLTLFGVLGEVGQC